MFPDFVIFIDYFTLLRLQIMHTIFKFKNIPLMKTPVKPVTMKFLRLFLHFDSGYNVVKIVLKYCSIAFIKKRRGNANAFLNVSFYLVTRIFLIK